MDGAAGFEPATNVDFGFQHLVQLHFHSVWWAIAIGQFSHLIPIISFSLQSTFSFSLPTPKTPHIGLRCQQRTMQIVENLLTHVALDQRRIVGALPRPLKRLDQRIHPIQQQ